MTELKFGCFFKDYFYYRLYSKCSCFFIHPLVCLNIMHPDNRYIADDIKRLDILQIHQRRQPVDLVFF